MGEAEELLDLIRETNRQLKDAMGLKCKCSGFTIQYEGGCQCNKGKAVSDAQGTLGQLIDSV